MSDKDKSRIEVYTKKVKDKGTSVEDTMNEIKRRRLGELDKLQIENLIKEERARLAGGGQPNVGLSTSFLTHIMQLANVDPDKATKFLDSLDEDKINKLSRLSAMGQTGNIQSIMPFLKNENTRIEDVIAIYKMMQPQQPAQPQQQVTLEGISKIIESVRKND